VALRLPGLISSQYLNIINHFTGQTRHIACNSVIHLKNLYVSLTIETNLIDAKNLNAYY
jgi:hypothetical protein